jgi:hypothetical protein
MLMEQLSEVRQYNPTRYSVKVYRLMIMAVLMHVLPSSLFMYMYIDISKQQNDFYTTETESCVSMKQKECD